jgi:hypothetical protein
VNRSRLNFVVDLTFFVLLLAMLETGLIVRYVLPPGSGGRGRGGGLSLLGLGRHEWGTVHFWLSIALLTVLLLHMVLHWGWVHSVAVRWFRRAGAPAERPAEQGSAWAAGVLFASVAVVAGLFVLSNRCVREERPSGGPGAPGYRGGRASDGVDAAGAAAHEQAGATSDSDVRGNMTLGECACALDISVADITSALRLPSDTAPGEKLGRLGQTYGFDLQHVRTTLRSRRHP